MVLLSMVPFPEHDLVFLKPSVSIWRPVISRSQSLSEPEDAGLMVALALITAPTLIVGC